MCLKVCTEFNKLVLNKKKINNKNENYQNKKIHKIIKLANKTEDDIILHSKKIDIKEINKLYRIMNDF